MENLGKKNLFHIFELLRKRQSKNFQCRKSIFLSSLFIRNLLLEIRKTNTKLNKSKYYWEKNYRFKRSLYESTNNGGRTLARRDGSPFIEIGKIEYSACIATYIKILNIVGARYFFVNANFVYVTYFCRNAPRGIYDEGRRVIIPLSRRSNRQSSERFRA